MSDVAVQEVNETGVVPLEETKQPTYQFGRSKTAQLMQVEPLMDNFDIETKVRTIDSHVEDSLDEEYRQTEVGYKLGLEKIMQQLGINYMEEMKRGRNMEIIDRLFSRIALKDKLSSGTYLQKAREMVRQAKVERLKGEMKSLKALAVVEK